MIVAKRDGSLPKNEETRRGDIFRRNRRREADRGLGYRMFLSWKGWAGY